MVSLTEEGYFMPLFDWYSKHGMLFGSDHGGRGTDVTEFGDYFRTQRWMSGPGNDAPQLGVSVIKNKVHASIAHLYQRHRVWLEGFYSSGWGTATADLTKAALGKLGPLPADGETSIEVELAGLQHVDPSVPAEIGGKVYHWKPYEYSWRFGVCGDPGLEPLTAKAPRF